jgi:translation initiation factor IF-2
MTETKETTDKTLRGAVPRKPLSLKRTVESGHVRQNFSHGRSKSVVVEKKKKRTISGPGAADAEEAATPQSEADRLLAEVIQRPGGLRPDELDARRRALEAAKERAELEERERARLEALRPKPEPVQEAPPTPTAPEPEVAEKTEPPEAEKAPVEVKERPDEKAKVAEAPKRIEQVAKRSGRALDLEPEVEEDTRAKKKGAKPAKSPVKIGDERRERIKLTINNAFDEAQRERSLASLKRRRERESCARRASCNRATRSCVRSSFPR